MYLFASFLALFDKGCVFYFAKIIFICIIFDLHSLGPAEVENFLWNFSKLTIYSETIWGPRHEKHKIRENFNR